MVVALVVAADYNTTFTVVVVVESHTGNCDIINLVDDIKCGYKRWPINPIEFVVFSSV